RGLDADSHDRLQQRGTRLFHAIAKCEASGDAKADLVRIHFMERSVINGHTEIHHGITGQKAALRRFANSFFNGGNVVAGYRAAKNIVHKFESTATRQRLNADLAISELAMSAGLLFMTAMSFGARANGFSIRNLRRL